jgi:hypothetical protein
MSGKKEEDIDTTKPYETEEVVAAAVPAYASNEPPIPDGHSRFYCNKCHTVSYCTWFRLLLVLRNECGSRWFKSLTGLTQRFFLSLLFSSLQPYDLPNKATSWRCANCMEFNSTTPGECPWCTIL